MSWYNPAEAAEVMALFYKFVADSSDAVILLTGDVATPVLALIMAILAPNQHRTGVHRDLPSA